MFDTDSNPLQTPSNNPEPPKDPTVLPTIEITDISVDSSKTSPVAEEVSMWSYTPPTVDFGPSEKMGTSKTPTFPPTTTPPATFASTTVPTSTPPPTTPKVPVSQPLTSTNQPVATSTSSFVSPTAPVPPQPSATPTFNLSTTESPENFKASSTPVPPVSYAPVSEMKPNAAAPLIPSGNESAGIPAGPTSFPYGSPTPPTPLREQPTPPISQNYQTQPGYPNDQPINTGYITPPVFPQQPPVPPNPYGGYQGQPVAYPPQPPAQQIPQPQPQPYNGYQAQPLYGGYPPQQPSMQQQAPPTQPMGYGAPGQPAMYGMPPAPVKKEGKSKTIAAILCLFGPLGVHRFYLGYIGRGILYAALTIVGLFLTWIPGWMYTVQSSYKGYGASSGAVDVSGYNIFYYIGIVVFIAVLVLVVLDFIKILTGKMKTKAGKDLY